MKKEIRVAVIEDLKPLRAGLCSLIGGTPGFRVVGNYGSMEEALPAAAKDVPEVVLLDIGLPGMSAGQPDGSSGA